MKLHSSSTNKKGSRYQDGSFTCNQLNKKEVKILDKGFENFYGEFNILLVESCKRLVYVGIKCWIFLDKLGFEYNVYIKKQERIIEISSYFLQKVSYHWNYSSNYDIPLLMSEGSKVFQIKSASFQGDGV